MPCIALKLCSGQKRDSQTEESITICHPLGIKKFLLMRPGNYRLEAEVKCRFVSRSNVWYENMDQITNNLHAKCRTIQQCTLIYLIKNVCFICSWQASQAWEEGWRWSRTSSTRSSRPSPRTTAALCWTGRIWMYTRRTDWADRSDMLVVSGLCALLIVQYGNQRSSFTWFDSEIILLKFYKQNKMYGTLQTDAFTICT